MNTTDQHAAILITAIEDPYLKHSIHTGSTVDKNVTLAARVLLLYLVLNQKWCMECKVSGETHKPNVNQHTNGVPNDK